MKFCILMGSPRKNGNTIALLKPFMEELSACGAQYDLVWLYDKDIKPCIACRKCQADWSIFGCVHEDDARQIFDQILSSDMVVLATPIYSWFCTAPMKALLDRLMYGMNKYYGDEKGPALWAGKRLALLTTCGYPPKKGADLFEDGIKRYCGHSQLVYTEMLSEHDRGYKSVFMDEGKAQRARAYARKLFDTVSDI